MKLSHNFTKYLLAFLFFFSFMIGRTAPASSEETYVFERMWPTLQQPWYLYGPTAVVIDNNDYIYVADSENHGIQKFTLGGQFVTKWGNPGNGDREFFEPRGIEIDSSGYIYVADSGNNRIQKFTSDGQFVTKWGNRGDGDGEFLSPLGMAIDSSGYIYIADSGNNRIQKFSLDGQFVTKWGNTGDGDGEFKEPRCIAIDSSGYVYVADRLNNRVQKFTADGQFVTKWGYKGRGDGEFFSPSGIAIDGNGDVYVVDGQNSRVQKFTSDGQFVTKWGSNGNGDGEFQGPWGIDIDSNGYIYVADDEKNRIQKFTSDGQFVTKWGSGGNGDGEFDYPNGIYIDSNGFVYIADKANDRIQKFTSDGQFVDKWGNGIPISFFSPVGVAVDNNGYIYVANESRGPIHKLTSDGQFVAEWLEFDAEDGELFSPLDTAVDSSGYVYVADSKNNRIQKFTSDGQFVTKWGIQGSGDGEFDYPSAMTIDSNGYVYVLDTYNNRIQKFTSDGQFITKWGNQGSVDGQFNFYEGTSPWVGLGIAADASGNVYVLDTYNERIQKFTSDGQFVDKWGSAGSGDGEFSLLSGIAIDSSGYIYVTDSGNNCVQKFTSDGQFITKWGEYGEEDGEFYSARGIAIDSNGYVYVADSLNFRVQKFTSDGQFVDKWGSDGSGDGEFRRPQGIAIDDNGYVYVVDEENHIIQKFTLDGQFVAKLGSDTIHLFSTAGIAIDSSGYIYVTDGAKCHIQKFTSDGEFVTRWGYYGHGDGEGEFTSPSGIAIDSNGYVYVVDYLGNRIQKFTSDGEFVTKWGTVGSGDGEFNNPQGIAVDNSGYIWVADSLNYRVQKFTSDGQFVDKWGSMGSDPGMFAHPASLAFDSSGRVFITEHGNNRIQVFAPEDVIIDPETVPKAIIVAGGGFFEGNNLWDATQMCANFAYRALTYQGFTKNSIYYISSDTDLDLDNNGELDDVDADATNANLENAIITWAAGADNLVVYLVDHGGEGTFRMSETETLSATDLDAWLDQVQETIPGNVTVIYDACESGSFISQLTPPSGKERIVISSTSVGESAHFVTQGSVSFSNYFWTHIFNGFNIKNAFDLAKEAIGFTTDNQHPLLDDNGNGIGNDEGDGLLAENTFIGNGTVIQGDSPVIGSVFDPLTITDTNSALLYASDVTDDDGIARVWAVIRPPYYYQQSSDNPVYSLPSIDLMPVGDNRYEATYDGFYIEGTYTIAIYARDREGNTAVPELSTVSVNNPLSRKAIIVGGSWQTDSLWPAVERNVAFAYNVLNYQGYSDADIYLLSPMPIEGTEVDSDTSLSNLSYAINVWAQQGTQDVLLYMIVNGNHKSFRINQTEDISATELDTLLDNLQENIPGKVTVIYDACRSGSFLEELTPPEGKERILISSSSSDEPAHFLSEGDISFSRFFWTNIANGADVYDAFVVAKNAIWFSCMGQTPYLDDNGNGIGNEKQDGLLSRYYSIGVGIMLAGDDPVIGSVSSNQTLSGTSSGTIWADDVTTTGSIDRVWAVITPPGYLINVAGRPVIELPIMELTDEGDGLYEGTYSDFNTYGVYNIAIYAKDEDGNISIPSETEVFQEEGLGAWNLISLEKQPENANIEAVLENISDKVISVWAYIDGGWQFYDPENPGFSDLTTMEAGIGYWINIIEAGTLTVSGTAPSKSIEISSGWNLVGYNSETSQDIADALASIEGKYISVWAYIEGGWKVYDPENPGFSDLTIMEPGYGYWINASEACTWILP